MCRCLSSKEGKRGLQAMESTGDQTPYVVFFHKLDFLEGQEEIRSATLLFRNEIIGSLLKPSVDKVIMWLLASYLCMNIPCPSVYKKLLTALERLITGVNPKGESSTSKYQKFLLMLK